MAPDDTEPAGDSAPATPPSPDPAQAFAPEAASEGGETAVENAPEGQPDAPTYSFSTVDEALEHDDFKPHITRRAEEASRRAAEERDAFYREQYEPRLTKQGEQLGRIDSGLKKFLRVARDSAGSREAFDELVEDHEELFAAVGSLGLESSQRNREQAMTSGHQKGVEAVALTLLRNVNAEPEDVRNFQRRFQENWAKGDPSLETDLLNALTEGRVKQVKAELTKELEPTIRKNIEAEFRAKERNGTEPPVAVVGAGATAGGDRWNTKMEARTLHVQNKISNAEMRRINADPSIPEM